MSAGLVVLLGPCMAWASRVVAWLPISSDRSIGVVARLLLMADWVRA